MGAVIHDIELQDRRKLFIDRAHAGRLLAQRLAQYKDTNGAVLAIPAGGVPVAAEIARGLALPLDLVIVRKIQVPFNTEVGFGAMDPDGEVIFNQWFLKQLGLTDEDVLTQVRKTKEVIAQRSQLFRGGRPFPDVRGKNVIVVDDGLASGYTMCAAVRYVRKKAPAKVIVAVPTGSAFAVEELRPQTDELVCLDIRGGFRFAVADAYENWYDVPDEEVLAILRGASKP
jgi:predicted phosphoribosyltransferase